MLFTNCSQTPDNRLLQSTDAPFQRYLKLPLRMLSDALDKRTEELTITTANSGQQTPEKPP
jgi:hypothetical protein